MAANEVKKKKSNGFLQFLFLMCSFCLCSEERWLHLYIHGVSSPPEIQVGGLMLPVHVVGGGVARNSAGIGIVGVDEVEARAALLTPALELGHPSSAAPSAVTLKWRYVSIPSTRGNA